MFIIHSKKNARRILRDGAKTLFWEDIWLGYKYFVDQFPRLYNISFTVTVQMVKNRGWYKFAFRRTLHGETGQQWMTIREMPSALEVNDVNARVKWILIELFFCSRRLISTDESFCFGGI